MNTGWSAYIFGAFGQGTSGRAVRRWLCAAAIVVAGAIALPAVRVHADGFADGWVGTWGSSLMPPASAFLPARSFEDQTLRQVAHVSVGGRRVRIRLSNPFSATVFPPEGLRPDLSEQPLIIGAAQIAVHDGDSAIVPGSGRTLRFSGQTSIAIPAGGVVLSDPVTLDVPNRADLAISIYLPGPTKAASFLEESIQRSFIASGNQVAATALPGAEETRSRFYLTAVEVVPRDPVGVVVAFGDSITIGGDSTLDANHRWPDFLSARLNARNGRPRLGVMNHGIGCSRLLFDFCGQNGTARFDRDVAAVAGVTHVIVAYGLNDLGLPGAFGGFPEQVVSADDVIRGLHQVIQRAHASRIKAIGATITPIGSSIFPGFFTPEFEAKRQAVNRWIRTSGAFDGVIDFDRAVRDPAKPDQLLPIYNSGNGVHLSDAGYEAMANAINLSLFF
jgi:lysophospholipase L1-like esterase